MSFSYDIVRTNDGLLSETNLTARIAVTYEMNDDNERAGEKLSARQCVLTCKYTTA